jgi:hypothetical protein
LEGVHVEAASVTTEHLVTSDLSAEQLRRVTIHTFETTLQARDCADLGYYFKDGNRLVIANGDVLHVPSEQVVGVMVEAWPVAITDRLGHFYQLEQLPFVAVWMDLDYDNPVAHDYPAAYALALGIVIASELTRTTVTVAAWLVRAVDLWLT